MSDKKVNVELNTSVTYGGVSYLTGTREMPEDVAKIAVERGFGKVVKIGEAENSDDGNSTNLPTEAELSKMNVADLTNAAEAEGVSFDEGATKKEIVEAILSSREK